MVAVPSYILYVGIIYLCINVLGCFGKIKLQGIIIISNFARFVLM